MSVTVAIFGQRSFGAAVAHGLSVAGHRVEFISSPRLADTGDRDPLSKWADDTLTDWAAPGSPPGRVPPVDLIIAAHSHDFIGARTRARAREAIGYHPSLLPRHRGRDAVRWTIHMGDPVAGGSVYHLTNGVDCGPLIAQEHEMVLPGDTASSLWKRLFPAGVRMLVGAADYLSEKGHLPAVVQDERAATWEPSWERPRLHRPELLALGSGVREVSNGLIGRSAPSV